MKYKVLLLTSITLLTSVFATNAKNILSLKESITDNAIVYPSSFETDTKEMMENWYLKNYAIIDQNSIESHNYGEVSDAEYIKRLKKLPTEIEMPFNQIVRSYIERYVKRGRTLVAQMLGMCPYYMPIFEEALEKRQMPLELKYIPIIESALNPNAVSPAGAGGLWQFMVATAKGHGMEVNSLVDERRDPYRSSEKAAEYFQKLYNTYGDWSLAIAAYNCGPGNVNKAIRRAGTDHPDFWEIYNYLPKETRGYVPAFIAANYVMTYYKEHNISPTLTKKPLIIDTVQVNHRINFSQISQVLNIPIEEIRILNPQYRKDVIPGDIHPYTLALPSQQIYSYIMTEDKIVSYHRKQFEGRSTVQPGDIRSIVDDEVVSDDGYMYHEVIEGEDFVDIADRYGMQYDDLMELNNLNSTTLQTGQVLKVKKPSSNNDETVMGYAQNNNSSSSNNYGYDDSEEPMALNYNTSRNNNNNNNSYSSGHYGSDNRQVPERNNYNSNSNNRQSNVPQRNNANNRQSNNYNYDYEQQRQQEEAAAKKRQEEAAKKRRQEEAAAKKRKEEAAKKRQQEEAAKKRQQEEAERKRREAEKPISLTVKEGQNLTQLANQYGVTIDDIKRANGLTDDNIRIGETIKIPKKDAKGRAIIPQNNNNGSKNHRQGNKQEQQEQQPRNKKQEANQRHQKHQEQKQQPKPEPKPTKHTIKEGQNLTKLANQYGVSVEDIKRANGLKGDNIRIGEDIIIPTKKSSSHRQHDNSSTGKRQHRQLTGKTEKTGKNGNNNTVAPQKSSSKKRR